MASFAIHHLEHDRKRALDDEIHDLLAPGGVLADLEHVAPPTPARHDALLASLPAPEDGVTAGHGRTTGP
ncbi:MAG TPA: hypothetical protein VK904_03900 [Miltoncostaeaceae bacterium]|nr:hypothetical protein [Miltoncostaeaceae bacterium]